MEKLVCKKCQYIWIPRTNEVKECPKCKSRNWKKEEDKPTPIITTPIPENPFGKLITDIFSGGGGLQNDKPK